MRSLEAESNAMKERAKFALEWERRPKRGEARFNFAQCRRRRDATQEASDLRAAGSPPADLRAAR
jgi:hypothetical protein